MEIIGSEIMTKLGKFITKYKKEVIATLVFILCLGIFFVSYAFAAVEPVRSIVIQSEHTDFASGEEGSWQVTKSGYWTNYGEAEVTLDVDTSLMTNNQYTDIIFVLDISGSMAGDKLDRVKNDSKELISSLLSNQNNRAALITFDTESRIISELTNDEEQLTNEIDNLQVTGSTNYYQALVNVDSILQNYQKESDREMVILFLTDGYPNEDTPNQVTQYQYLKNTYPYITINGIQYEMGTSILSPIKEISDNQFIADMDTLNNVLFDASVAPVTYNTYQIIDYIDNENFTLESVNDINVSQGKVELTDEGERQKITWTLDNLASGREANLTMKLKLKEELIGQGGIYPTNESTQVISKIENQEEDVTTTNTPILADNYKVIYDGNAPDGNTVANVPEDTNYSVFSTIEISNQVPTCTGYEFKGWTITTNGVTRVGEDYFIMPESDVVIKAEWSKVGITKSMNGTVNNMGDPIMKRYTSSTNTDYHSSTYKSKITSVVTKDNMEIPSTAIETWDVSEAGDGSVIAYIEDDGRGTGTYKVTIGAQGNIIANPDSRYLFDEFENVESIDLTYVDTSQVTDMRFMLYECSSLTSLDVSNFDTSQVTYMGYMFSSCRSLTSLDLSSFDTSKVSTMTNMFSSCNNLSLIIFGDNWNTKQVKNMHRLFWLCQSLTSLDLSNFDTSNVTDMGEMFDGCSSLASLDVSNFDTSQVADMSYIFSSCRSLTNLDVSNFDTSQVTDMGGMFNGCSSLTALDLSNFNTIKVTDMHGMFDSCSSLTSLDLNNFDTSQVTDMSSMFEDCRNLPSLDLSSVDTTQVTNMNSMFRNCISITSLDLSNFDTNKATDMYAMFSSCTGLVSLNLNGWNTENVTNMVSMFYYCENLTSLDVSSFNTNKVLDMGYTSSDYSSHGMFERCSKLEKIIFGDHWNCREVTNFENMFKDCTTLVNLDLNMFNPTSAINMSNMFYNCKNLLEVVFGDGCNASNVTDMSDMFSQCNSLQSLDLSGIYTNKLTDISHMFYYCHNLTNLTFGNNFNTSQVTDMTALFSNCRSLQKLDLSYFDTSQVIDMVSMFSGCQSLTNIIFGDNWNTSKVTNMGWMFSSCRAFTSLDLNNFDTSQVTYMRYMFDSCSSLTSLDLSSFDTSQVTNMDQMFWGCSSLASLNLSNFDTSKVTNMNGMFYSCSSLTSLDLSSFDTSQVTNMGQMFCACSSLTSLNLSSFDTSKVTYIELMFENCRSLTNLDMRNATFNATNYSRMFTAVPNSINIIVKDATAKTWIESRLSDAGKTGTVTIVSA